MKKSFYLLAILSILTSCGEQKKELKTARGNALGTTYSILYFDRGNTPKITASLDSIFNAVNTSLSTYISTSDISRINKGEILEVDTMFQEVFNLSTHIHKASNNYFDPTVGILVNAWGFGPKKALKNMNAKKVDSLMQFVGWDKVSLNNKNEILKAIKNIYLDFNAIAKGYCIDRIAVYMDQKGYENYLIEVGGELVAKGIHQEKQKPWVVGIDDPNQKATSRELITLLSLKNQAMATSGNYRKFKIDSVTGNKYVHIIDPHSGYTKPSNILSVSVLAENCATADAWATTFMSMPLEETKKILIEENLEGYIIYLNVEDEVSIYQTEGFKSQILE